MGKKETDYDKCTAKKSSPFELNQKRRLFSKQKEAEQRKGEIDEKESDCGCGGGGAVGCFYHFEKEGGEVNGKHGRKDDKSSFCL